MPRTPKPSGQPKRKVETRNPLPVFALFTEGDVTERDYFRPIIGSLSRSKKASARIEGSHSSPARLVELAIKHKTETRIADASTFQVWCIFDVEAPHPHSDLEGAISNAKRNNINLAISNPCFELWLILHYQDYGKSITTSAAVTLRNRLDKSKGKEVDSKIYIGRLSEAIDRARGLTTKHQEARRRVPDNNPSSDVYLLLEAMGIHSP